MHDAKRRQCRGGIGIATDGLVNTAVHALELEAELRAAIAGNALVLDYQPVVGPDGTVLSAEALVRWPHPVRGLIPPGEFLPVAQRSGLLRELDLWVLRTATREAAGWPQHGGTQPSVAVNLAGLLPADVGLPAGGQRHRRRQRAGAEPAGAGAGGDQPGRAAAARAGRDGRAGGARGPVRRRRLRHRLLLARPAQGAARRRRSRSTGRSSPTSPTTRSTSRWPGPWSTWPGRWAAARWPRAWRPPSSSTGCAASASTPTRAGCSPGRCRPHELRELLAGAGLATPENVLPGI